MIGVARIGIGMLVLIGWTGCSLDDTESARQQVLSTTLVDNGDPSGGFGTTILSERDSFNQVGDDFTLASSSLLHSLEWWGVHGGEKFSVRIFEVVAGVPDDTPLLDIDLGLVPGTPEIFPSGEHLFYQADLPSIPLGASEYLLSIVEKTPGDETRWFWSASCEDGCEGDSFRRSDDLDSWSVGNFDMAFRLIGTTVGKTEICHCPPGRPDRCRTLSVGSGAATAHLNNHGHDSLGACTP